MKDFCINAVSDAKDVLKIKKKKNRPDNSRALLIETKKVSNYIVSTIMQTSVKDASGFTEKVGTALASKLAGAGVAGGLLGLVGIATTAGSVLTGGLAVAVSYGTYKWLKSGAREYAALEPNERDIVDRAIVLARYAHEAIESIKFPTNEEMTLLYNQSIEPLDERLHEHQADIASRLNFIYGFKFSTLALSKGDTLKENYKEFLQI